MSTYKTFKAFCSKGEPRNEEFLGVFQMSRIYFFYFKIEHTRPYLYTDGNNLLNIQERKKYSHPSVSMGGRGGGKVGTRTTHGYQNPRMLKSLI